MAPACAEVRQVPRSLPCHWVGIWPGVVAVRSGERLQQGLGLPQVDGVKPLSEPAIDRGQQLLCLGSPALLLPQPAKAHRRPQLEQFGLLLAGNLDGLSAGWQRLRDPMTLPTA